MREETKEWRSMELYRVTKHFLARFWLRRGVGKNNPSGAA